MRFFKRILNFFSIQERFKLLGLLLLIVTTGVIEILGISLMMPFMGMLVNPQMIMTQPTFHSIYTYLQFDSPNRFIFALGLFIFIILVAGNVFSAIVSWISARFSWGQSYIIEKRLFMQYLSQPYIFFVDKNSAHLSNNILSEVQRFVRNVLMPLFEVTKSGFVSLCIIALLFFIDPVLAILVMVVLGGSYLFIFYGLRSRMTKWAKTATDERSRCVKMASEIFSSVKDIKIYHQENNIVEDFSRSAKIFAEHETKGVAAISIPRYMLEAIAFGGMLLIVLYLLRFKHDFSQILPLIALYTFAGYRLLPMLQMMFASLTQIRYNHAALDNLYADMEYLDQHKNEGLSEQNLSHIKPIAFADKILFKDVTYYYPKTEVPALSAVELVINANTTVGIVGRTGSGKTTFVDILLGLLTPIQGTFSVDGHVITDLNRFAWQKNLGYVSQHAHLNDDTIAHNIAFTGGGKVEMEKVIAVAKAARIHDFIMSELPLGYETIVGERGVRLSGGQRQRICIARALYHDPKVLVLDEATSALDNETEHAVMESIRQLGKTKTIIMIAHRLSTVKTCDKILVLNKGQVVGEGTYDELLENNEIFRTLVKK